MFGEASSSHRTIYHTSTGAVRVKCQQIPSSAPWVSARQPGTHPVFAESISLWTWVGIPRGCYASQATARVCRHRGWGQLVELLSALSCWSSQPCWHSIDVFSTKPGQGLHCHPLGFRQSQCLPQSQRGDSVCLLHIRNAPQRS